MAFIYSQFFGLDSFKRVWAPKTNLEDGIERHSPGTIDNSAFNLCSKIDLHDVIVLENGLIPRIRCPVRRDYSFFCLGASLETIPLS